MKKTSMMQPLARKASSNYMYKQSKYHSGIFKWYYKDGGIGLERVVLFLFSWSHCRIIPLVPLPPTRMSWPLIRQSPQVMTCICVTPGLVEQSELVGATLTLLVNDKRKMQFSGARREGEVCYLTIHAHTFVTLHHTLVYTHTIEFPNQVLCITYMHTLHCSVCLCSIYINSFILHTHTLVWVQALKLSHSFTQEWNSLFHYNYYVCDIN